ncbi:DsbA family protein [Enterococcus thailandicus]|uniref:Thioredoxin n=1 Tax=Enterococcus thailandicus TaxID=417368 RepID=A0A179EQ16_ENTTH|nr:DsbA family protein [Enterococcus thailandicus]ASZ07310.1 thioredoxin [Enterococcus thailandicus]MDT2752059.1 DsbA family protein [Enterococcus thailandicus]MDT2777063.1 DsbA family protein [Enterococcus thailandicus]MDT2794038.1 DsbA family protein [Enterococcus thailandicus]OAQ55274.1 thioredoxin [Enterococcus thailandicus]
MDISVIDATKTNETTGIYYGDTAAPQTTIEFLNLACPYCKKWFEESFLTLDSFVQEGKVNRLIKLFDKEKESLQRGNVMHHHITANDGKKALAEIKQIFEMQDQWKELSLEGVAQYATQELGLTYQPDMEMAKAIIDEANAAHIQFVPTIILDQTIFDESITLDELTSLIN